MSAIVLNLSEHCLTKILTALPEDTFIDERERDIDVVEKHQLVAF